MGAIDKVAAERRFVAEGARKIGVSPHIKQELDPENHRTLNASRSLGATACCYVVIRRQYRFQNSEYFKYHNIELTLFPVTISEPAKI